MNPGSVGLPFSDWAPRTIAIAPWAEYGILSHDEGRLHVDLRRTTYDVEALLRLSLESGMPHAEWWAGCWQLDDALPAPPTTWRAHQKIPAASTERGKRRDQDRIEAARRAAGCSRGCR